MDTDLNNAFLNTNYQVLVDGQHLSISLTFANEWLFSLDINNSTEWCFITAWNPLPHIFERKENNKRNRLLLNHILGEGYDYYEGKGTSEDGKWSENSFFILGINKTRAIELGAIYSQVAIIVGKGASMGNLQYISYD